MLIDWYTVGAQALNFVILVWLMKRYLYKPILHAIDDREKQIAAELTDAAAKEAEANRERDEFQRKSKDLDQQRATLLKKATDDANTERQRLFGEAHQAANALSAKRQEALRTDAKNLNRAIQQRTQREVFSIARKVLMDLATTSLEERLTAVFTRRLRELDGPTKAGLVKALEAASGSALVRSAFELPTEQRAIIQNALNETFSADVHVRFETAPDLVSGIDLTVSGQKVGWSIDGYLASLEDGIHELLKEKEGAEAKAQSERDGRPAPKLETAKSGPEPRTGATPVPISEGPDLGAKNR
jgi:F-type H+-transporting ATPase subunit b